MDYKIVSHISELGDFQKDLGLTKLISLDTETTGLDTIIEEMVLLQVKLNNHIYIFNCRSLGERYTTYIIDLIKASEKTCVIQNAKYDVEVIKTNTGILLENIYDLFVTEVLITNGLATRFPSLAKMVLKYEGVVLKKEVRLEFTDPNLVLEKKHYDYAAKDIIYLESIRKKQLEEVKKSGQEKVHELEMKFLPVLAQMKLNGVFLNLDKWHTIEENYRKKAKIEKEKMKDFFMNKIDFSKFKNLLEAVEAIEITTNEEGKSLRAKFRMKELEKVIDVDLAKDFIRRNINVNSTDQIKNLLNLSGIKVKDTLADNLKKKNKKYPITKTIIKYREYKKRVSTYGDKFTSKVHPRTGRIHANYYQIKTASGRLACAKPNMQNIIAEDDYRASFEAEPGNKFITIDYSQQEYRIIGEFTGEQTIIDAYNDGKDMHIITASLVNEVPIDEVTREQRTEAKPINFGLFYGANEWGLKHRLGITLKEARRIMKAIFEGIPRFVSFRTAFENQVVKNLCSVTMTGRKRYFKERTDFIDGAEYMKYINRVRREGFNHPIQGTGADMTKLAMCYCHYNNPFGDKFMMVTQGHDEIGFEVAEEIAEEALEFAKGEMIKAGEKFIHSMPVEVEGHIKDHWSKG
jgi:DNA polymerase I-like protein with 3'-5' exonuclease and polymerase domains